MSTPEKTEKLLTSREVRRKLRCSSRTLYTYRETGKLPYRRINSRRFLYPPASVEALLRDEAAPGSR